MEGTPRRHQRAPTCATRRSMTVGTTLSRLTGYVRIAVQTAALGVTVGTARQRLHAGQHHSQHRLRADPRRHPDLGLRAGVRRPPTTERARGRVRPRAGGCSPSPWCCCPPWRIAGIVFAPQIMRLYLVASDAADREAQIELGVFLLRWFMPQIVFYGIGAIAAGLLNTERRFAAPMFAPILNNLVAIATFARLRDAPRRRRALGRRHHVAGEDRARRRHHARRRRDDRGALAVVARDRLPVASRRRVGPPGHPPHRAALRAGSSSTSPRTNSPTS